MRVQADRVRYHLYMKEVLENQENLDIKQAEVTEIRADDTGAICELVTKLGAVYQVKKVILATGTYLKGRIFVGEASYESGPDGTQAANRLSASLEKMGISLRRFKTGTPARIHRRSIDFSVLEEQPGDDPVSYTHLKHRN